MARLFTPVAAWEWPQLQPHLTDDEPEAQNLTMPHLRPRPRSRVGRGSQTRAVVSGPSSWCLAVPKVPILAGAEDVGSAGELGIVCLQRGLSLLFFFLGDNTHMVCKGLPHLPPILSPTPDVHSWPLGVLTAVPRPVNVQRVSGGCQESLCKPMTNSLTCV